MLFRSQEKIKALEDATAENKKYVELVGPASDILALKEKAQADAEAAKAALSDAKSKANEMLSAAGVQAAAIKGAALEEAKGISDKANELVAAAEKAKADAQSALKRATEAEAAAQASADAAASREAAAKAAEEAAKDAKAQADAAKAEIIAKHQEFIRTL